MINTVVNLNKMEEEPVNTIRESTRRDMEFHRRVQRDEENDVRRCMDNLSIAGSTTDIANKLKTKSSVTVSELQTLKSGLMEDPKNIELVLNVHGALRGLVRELTGHEVKKQCIAAGCLCNLALGDERAAVTVAKAAGPYLVAALDCLTAELAETCAWAVGNFCGAGARASLVLSAQGAPGKLCALARAPWPDARAAALYALLHLAYQTRDELRTEHLVKILEALSESDCTVSSAQLLFIISCHNDFNIDRLSVTFLHKVLQNLSVSLKKHTTKCSETKNCCEVVFLIRTLANLGINEDVYRFLTSYFVENSMPEGFKALLSKESDVKESLLWLLGNLFNYNSVFFTDLFQ